MTGRGRDADAVPEMHANNNNGGGGSHVPDKRQSADESLEQSLVVIRPTRRRYFILLMYGICSMEKSFQWINLSTVTNKVALYYGVDNFAVNWTSVLFMITFIPLVLPTGWLIERIGLRRAVLVGSTGITLGACIKCFACAEDRFWVVILGQIVVSLSEQFIFCIPARIASVWFPDHQVSLATGFGIFGNQCGIALGFLVPQALLRGLETRAQIGDGLARLFTWTAAIAALTWLVLLALFDDAPRLAPGRARYNKILEEQLQREQMLTMWQEAKVFGGHLLELARTWNSVFLVIAYGINVGTVYAIQTCLNQMIAPHQTASVAAIAVASTSTSTSTSASTSTPTSVATPTRASAQELNQPNANELVGTSGLIIIFAGMAGALFWGHLCDRTHRYMLINRILYAGAILSVGVFAFTLKLTGAAHYQLCLYLASGLMGFMLIGYTVAGLDTIVELTYPIPEMVSTSVMNLSPQIFGIAITFLCSTIVDRAGSDLAAGFLIGCLLVGLVFTGLIREQLKRQQVVADTKTREQQIGAGARASLGLEA